MFRGEMLEKGKIWLKSKVVTILENFEDYLDAYGVVDERKRQNLHLSPEEIRRKLTDPEAEIAVEIGSKLKRLHSHSLISFEHSPALNFRVNLGKLRGALPKGFHLDVKFVRSHDFALSRYLAKDQEKPDTKTDDDE